MYAYWITVNYREAYDIFASNGILFNHESPIRGETFVTRKFTMAIANMALGNQKKLYVGNLDAKRDWGHAKDYVEMMWMILQSDHAEDWVIATGKSTSVRDFIKMAFDCVGVQLEFKGKGISETGYVKSFSRADFNFNEGDDVVKVDPNYFRPTEVDLLVGDASKAKKKLGWEPKISLEEMINEMVQEDLNLIKKNNSG